MRVLTLFMTNNALFLYCMCLCCGTALVSMRIRIQLFIAMCWSWSDFTKLQSLKGRKPGLLVNFVQFPCSWIRIRIPNTERIRIRVQDSQIIAILDPYPHHWMWIRTHFFRFRILGSFNPELRILIQKANPDPDPKYQLIIDPDPEPTWHFCCHWQKYVVNLVVNHYRNYYKMWAFFLKFL
jgi:hypothetical protein